MADEAFHVMRLALLFMFAASALAQNMGTITIIPKSDDSATNEVRYRELSANGVNFVGFKAPTVIASDVSWTLPAADAAGCWQSDGAGNMAIGSCAGGGGNLVPTIDDTYQIGTSVLRWKQLHMTDQLTMYRPAATSTQQIVFDVDGAGQTGRWVAGPGLDPDQPSISAFLIYGNAGSSLDLALSIHHNYTKAWDDLYAMKGGFLHDGLSVDNGAGGWVSVITGGSTADAAFDSIIPLKLGVSDLGTLSTPWANIFSEDVHVVDSDRNSAWTMSIFDTGGTIFDLHDAGGSLRLRLNQATSAMTSFQDFFPGETATYDIGSSTAQWAEAHMVDALISDDAWFGGVGLHNVSGALEVQLAAGGRGTLLAASVGGSGTNALVNVHLDNLTFHSTAGQGVGSNMPPSADNIWDFGSASFRWKNIHTFSLSTSNLDVIHTTDSADINIQTTSAAHYAGVTLLDSAGAMAGSMAYGNSGVGGLANTLFMGSRKTGEDFQLWAGDANRLTLKGDGTGIDSLVDIDPNVSGTRSLGNSAAKWDAAMNDVTIDNLTVTNCTGCGTAPGNMVTTDTTQTITGQKTFNPGSNVTIFDGNIRPLSNLSASLGASSFKFANAHLEALTVHDIAFSSSGQFWYDNSGGSPVFRMWGLNFMGMTSGTAPAAGFVAIPDFADRVLIIQADGTNYAIPLFIPQ